MNEAEWTLATLKAYLEDRIALQQQINEAAHAAMRESHQASLAAMRNAVEKAEVSIDKRFESVNEFRRTLNDITVRMYPRVEAESAIRASVERTEALAKALNEKYDTRLSSVEDKSVTGYGNLDAKFSALADRNYALTTENGRRISGIEGRQTGIGDHRTTLISVCAFLVALVVACVTIYSALSRTGHTAPLTAEHPAITSP